MQADLFQAGQQWKYDAWKTSVALLRMSSRGVVIAGFGTHDTPAVDRVVTLPSNANDLRP